MIQVLHGSRKIFMPRVTKGNFLNSRFSPGGKQNQLGPANHASQAIYPYMILFIEELKRIAKKCTQKRKRQTNQGFHNKHNSTNSILIQSTKMVRHAYTST